jgi:hypothetical protein
VAAVGGVFRISQVEGRQRALNRWPSRETVMKRMLVAVAIALVPVAVAPALASTNAGSLNSQPAAAAERPTICFYFGPWKYCI